MKINIFSTYSLDLSATLSLWFPVNLDKTNGNKKVLFVFEDSKKLQESVDKYWKRELLVEPRQYFDNLKALKARIYEEP